MEYAFYSPLGFQYTSIMTFASVILFSLISFNYSMLFEYNCESLQLIFVKKSKFFIFT